MSNILHDIYSYALCFEDALCPFFGTRYEHRSQDDNIGTMRFAKPKDQINVLVKYDKDDLPEPD